jgi:hypothetical protein
MNRKRSLVLKKFADEMKANPIVEQLPNDPIPGITTIEYIKELQELLVQTCIDYINKNGLTDLYGVHFNADSLNESAKWGSWQSCTDSYIKVEGLGCENYKRKDGEGFKMPYRYTIGEWM